MACLQFPFKLFKNFNFLILKFSTVMFYKYERNHPKGDFNIPLVFKSQDRVPCPDPS